jgi:hypothetical protein
MFLSKVKAYPLLHSMVVLLALHVRFSHEQTSVTGQTLGRVFNSRNSAFMLTLWLCFWPYMLDYLKDKLQITGRNPRSSFQL